MSAVIASPHTSEEQREAMAEGNPFGLSAITRPIASKVDAGLKTVFSKIPGMDKRRDLPGTDKTFTLSQGYRAPVTYLAEEKHPELLLLGSPFGVARKGVLGFAGKQAPKLEAAIATTWTKIPKGNPVSKISAFGRILFKEMADQQKKFVDPYSTMIGHKLAQKTPGLKALPWTVKDTIKAAGAGAVGKAAGLSDIGVDFLAGGPASAYWDIVTRDEIQDPVSPESDHVPNSMVRSASRSPQSATPRTAKQDFEGYWENGKKKKKIQTRFVRL
jgi:hypothetical protein